MEQWKQMETKWKNQWKWYCRKTAKKGLVRTAYDGCICPREDKRTAPEASGVGETFTQLQLPRCPQRRGKESRLRLEREVVKF